MFTFSSPPRACQPFNTFSSPLMPRSPNIQTFSPPPTSKPFLSSPLTSPVTPQSHSHTPLSESKRPIFNFADIAPAQRKTDPRIPQRRLQSRNPLVQSSSARQQQRRQKFLDDVQTRREAKAWDGRVDQISRQKFLAEQRQWEAEHAQEAPEVEDPEKEYEDMFLSQDGGSGGAGGYGESYRGYAAEGNRPWSVQQVNGGMAAIGDIESEADAIAQAEREEIEALIALQEQVQAESPLYGSDDDDFDEAMVEAFEHAGGGEEMDMS